MVFIINNQSTFSLPFSSPLDDRQKLSFGLRTNVTAEDWMFEIKVAMYRDDSIQEEFLSMDLLANGSLSVGYNDKGEVRQLIVSEVQVADNQWHIITLDRQHRNLSLTVDKVHQGPSTVVAAPFSFLDKPLTLNGNNYNSNYFLLLRSIVISCCM